MSITRTPACRVKFCPHPRDPDFHICWCGKLAVEHHDIVGGGMGGGGGHHENPETIICLCHEHHEGVTIGGYKDAIEDGYYVVRNRKGQRIIKVRLEVGSAAADDGTADIEPEPAGELGQHGPGPMHSGYSQQDSSAVAPPASGERGHDNRD